MRIFTTPPHGNFDDYRSFRDRAIGAGYDGILMTDNRHDPFLPLAILARRTSGLELGTAVAVGIARGPLPLAHAAWDLHHNSGERFILGLGAQTDGHISGRYGLSVEGKFEKFREIIMAIREYWRCWTEGGHLDISGKYFNAHVMPDSFRPTTKNTSHPKIFVLCKVEQEWDIALEYADGIFVHPMLSKIGLDRYGKAILEVQKTRRFEVVLSPFVMIEHGDDYAEAGNRKTAQLVQYYWEQDELRGLWREICRRVSVDADNLPDQVNLWSVGDRDSVFREICLIGAIDQMPKKLRDGYSRVVTSFFPGVTSGFPPLLNRDQVDAFRRV